MCCKILGLGITHTKLVGLGQCLGPRKLSSSAETLMSPRRCCFNSRLPAQTVSQATKPTYLERGRRNVGKR